MAFVVTIAGVDKTALIRKLSLRITMTANGRSTAAFDVLSLNASYRPAQDAEVIITENGTRIFAGLVNTVREVGAAGGKGVDAIRTSVSCYDFNQYPERRFVNETLADGTLKSQLTTLVATYLATYGVTLSGGQVNGPTLKGTEWKYVKLTEVLNQLMSLTADAGEPYIWKIDPFKVLSAYQSSTVAAPFNLSGNLLTQVIGDIEVETHREQYANKIIVKVPAKTELNRVESFTGDGTTNVFQLQYQLTQGRGVVVTDAASNLIQTLTTTPYAGTATWTYDQIANTITYESGAPFAGADIQITFDGTFTGEGIAQDAGEIAAHGLWEKVLLVEDVPDDTTAQALADAELAKRTSPVHTIKYATHNAGILPGQTQTVAVSRRNLSDVAIITQVDIRDKGKDLLERMVTATIDPSQTNLDRDYRDVYKIWNGDKLGGSVATAAEIMPGAGVIGQGGPSPPFKSIQFNDTGRFGGKAEWIYDKTTNTVMLGTNHDPGTGSINMLIGDGHTVI